MCLISVEVEHKVLHRQWTGASTHKQFTFLQMKWNEIYHYHSQDTDIWSTFLSSFYCTDWMQNMGRSQPPLDQQY